MKKQAFLFVTMMMLAFITLGQTDVTRQAEPSQTNNIKTKQTVGVAIDLLPPIISATTGNLGYSAQLWYGFKKFRGRGVIAGFTLPDKLMGNNDFSNLETKATAVIIDYFLKNNFRGWWFGTGVEMWNNTITSKVDKNNYSFNDYVATAGGGYILNIYRNFYIEPWGAVHYVFSHESVNIGSTKYATKRFQGELSIKIGWHF